jgi:glycosyltransferase involved in cell wall biosynthesis
VRCVWTPGRDNKSFSTLSFGLTGTIDASLRGFDAVLVLNIANGFWFPALRAARIPFAVNTDGIEWRRAKWSALGRMTFRAGAQMTARHANILICDSKAIGEVWKSLSGRDSAFIPYGADVPRAVGRERLDHACIPERYALVVARLAPENNVELTLDALDLLGERAPHAVIVGSANFDAPVENRLAAMAESGRITWLGHVSDQLLLTQLWAHCSVYVHGHSVGGTNPALLQALGAGAPTLALDTAFNAEVLPHAQHLFAPDARALAGRLAEVAGSEAMQTEMADLGRQIVSERYRWDAVCDAYADVLVSLAQGRRDPSLTREPFFAVAPEHPDHDAVRRRDDREPVRAA